MTVRNNTLYVSTIAITSKTAAEWTTANPVLIKGQLGIESDTRRMKCGNGTSNWANLAYLDSDIQTAITNLQTVNQTQSDAISDLQTRVGYLEDLAMAIMETTTSVIDNIMKGEVQ